VFALYSPHTSEPQTTRCSSEVWVSPTPWLWGRWGPLLWEWVSVGAGLLGLMPTVLLPKLALNKPALRDGGVSVDLCRRCALRINYLTSVRIISRSDLRAHLNQEHLWLLDTLSLPVKLPTVVLGET